MQEEHRLVVGNVHNTEQTAVKSNLPAKKRCLRRCDTCSQCEGVFWHLRVWQYPLTMHIDDRGVAHFISVLRVICILVDLIAVKFKGVLYWSLFIKIKPLFVVQATS